MQYILTEDEYAKLKQVNNTAVLQANKKLQDLCTKIADTMPVKTWMNDGEPTPWGCIHSDEDEWYCDECPVSTICPEPRKYWSK